MQCFQQPLKTLNTALRKWETYQYHEAMVVSPAEVINHVSYGNYLN